MPDLPNNHLGNWELEICVDSVQSALLAEKAGATRLELCENLSEGGVTPSIAKVKSVVRHVAIPIFVLLRPRAGDFLYDRFEWEIMLEELGPLQAQGVSGVVIGALDAQGQIDWGPIGQIIHSCRELGLSVTFHRAIDMAADPVTQVQKLAEMGVDRILTSGGAASALDGIEALSAMVDAVQDSETTILAGGGVRAQNLGVIARRTGIRAFHSSAKKRVPSLMEFRGNVQMGTASLASEFSKWMVDQEEVKAMHLELMGMMEETDLR
ncbi:copper homeostasis protein CutC [Pontibacter sp. G13]|uniref:copper homeostasis protein CutC n=1 Tax=Pontibacter sp. G13 TaxID=3074898 RepID=UPI00288B4E56|nr:copper homeostasis protein CutC [Pontibacter sp. G13]WNJ17825.1 copper homeostasis protein CutC [Pontibacter sp. G13]